jgi:DNA polymerase
VPLKPKPPSCQGCSAYRKNKSFVPGSGPMDAKVALVGQGPGASEAYQGYPFVGPSGRMLNRWLFRSGLERHKCWVGNISQCWSQSDRPPSRAEVAHCREAHWGPVLESLENLKVIVLVGV